MFRVGTSNKWPRLGAVDVLSDREFGVMLMKCPLLKGDNQIRPEPTPTGFHRFYPVRDYRRVPSWYNDPDFIAVAENQLALPAEDRTGFFFDFQVPERTAVLLAVLRTNPRTGEPVDPEEFDRKKRLLFFNSSLGQNFYTPGSWRNRSWVDGGMEDPNTIRQFFFADRRSGLSLDDFTVPPSLRGSDTLMLAFWRWIAPMPEEIRSKSFRLERGGSGGEEEIAVALGGLMAQTVKDVPKFDTDGRFLWEQDLWAFATMLVIRICPPSLFAQIDPSAERPTETGPQNQGGSWIDKSGYPPVKKTLPF